MNNVDFADVNVYTINPHFEEFQRNNIMSVKDIIKRLRGNKTKFGKQIKRLLTPYIDSDLPVMFEIKSKYTDSIEYEPIVFQQYDAISNSEESTFEESEYNMLFTIEIANISDFLKEDKSFWETTKYPKQDIKMYDINVFDWTVWWNGTKNPQVLLIK